MRATEKRVINGLCSHLETHGFTPEIGCAGAVLDKVAETGYAWIEFWQPGVSDYDRYAVLFIMGNGEDVVSDYTWPREGNADAWKSAMDEFEPRDHR